MASPIRQFAKRETIFNAGDRAGDLPKLLSGAAIIYTILPDGRRQVLDLVGPGDFLHFETEGELDHFAEALIPCQVTWLAAEALLTNAEHAKMVFGQIRKRLEVERRHIAMLSQKTAEERLADFVRLAADCLGEEEGRFELPLTRQQIADFTGLTIETVSRTFARWGRDNTLTRVGQRTYQIGQALAA